MTLPSHQRKGYGNLLVDISKFAAAQAVVLQTIHLDSESLFFY
jgi:hypothetical protein